jgi:hypothetical protein
MSRATNFTKVTAEILISAKKPITAEELLALELYLNAEVPHRTWKELQLSVKFNILVED